MKRLLVREVRDAAGRLVSVETVSDGMTVKEQREALAELRGWNVPTDSIWDAEGNVLPGVSVEVRPR